MSIAKCIDKLKQAFAWMRFQTEELRLDYSKYDTHRARCQHVAPKKRSKRGIPVRSRRR